MLISRITLLTRVFLARYDTGEQCFLTDKYFADKFCGLIDRIFLLIHTNNSVTACISIIVPQLLWMPRKLYIVLCLSLVWFSCKKVDIAFGDQFLDNGYTHVVKVDSFTVDMATVQVDSFISSAKGVALLGGYNDPVFGKTNIESYFELAPPTYVDSFANTTFDSLVLILKPGKGYYGDTTSLLQVDVHRVTEPIAGYGDNPLGINNNRHFAVQPSPLASKSMLVRPNTGDLLQIRLDDHLGREFLQKLQNKADLDLQGSDAFLQYFHGLRLSTSNKDAQLVVGCQDSVIMRLYYKMPGLYTADRTVDFKLANSAHQFNSIQADRSGTVLKNLAASGMLPSSATNNTAYASYATGAMIKLRFPTVREILKLPGYAKIIKATLTVKPVPGSYIMPYSLPPELRLSQTTQLNQLGDDITILSSNGTPVAQTGNLVIDYLYGENTGYVYDVTSYLQALIKDATINQNGLLLVPPSPSLETQFNRVLAGDGNNSSGRTQLSIMYASIQ